MKERQKRNVLKEAFKYITVLMIILILALIPRQASASSGKELKVTFINVGQGDSALLECNGKFIMIDGGLEQSASQTLEYLKKRGVKKLEYIIATHDHKDHIGGFAAIIQNIPVGKVYRTRLSTLTDYTMRFNEAIRLKNIPTAYPTMGQTIDFEGAKITFMAPNSSGYASYNDNSIVVKVVFGKNSFLFTGDAEFQSEAEMIAKGYNLKSDVLKVGHHSALTSSSDAFIKAVDPSISLISCDERHEANFPRYTTLAKLSHSNVYRTDLSGDITMTSDGSEIFVDAVPFAYAEAEYNAGARSHVDTTEKESKLLNNVRVMSSEGDMELIPVEGDEDFDTVITDELTLNFLADYGISSSAKTEYALVPYDQNMEISKIQWTALKDTSLTLSEDFIGCVYVKYTNKLGNIVYRKTEGFTLAVTPPSNAAVTSSSIQLALLPTNAANSYTTYPSGELSLQFFADFGISGKSKTEYMLVNKGETFQKNGVWTEGDSLTINDNFIGRVYVRYTNNAGHQTLLKTNGFTLINGAPINTKVKSSKAGISLIGFQEESDEPVTVKSSLTLTFSADFGNGGKDAIEYQLVAKDGKYSAKTGWKKGNKAVVKKGFSGRVYVRFKDQAGNYVVKKTNDFIVK